MIFNNHYTVYVLYYKIYYIIIGLGLPRYFIYKYYNNIINDLLACPPHLLGKNCLSCSFQPGLDRVPLGTDGRHFVHCRRGLRLHGAVSDKVRDELCFVLERCGIRVVAERPSSHRQMSSFRQREGACLLKTPDLVLQDFHAPRSFTIIDIKIVDPSGICRLLRQSDGQMSSSSSSCPLP